MDIKSEILVEHNISPNEYYYLFHLANSIKCPIHVTVDYHKLEKKGFIKISDDIHIRQAAIKIFREIPYEYDEKENQMTMAIKNVESWIDDWRKLFPTQKDNSHLAYPLQGSRQDCIKKMKVFIKTNFKKNHFTKQMIFDATKIYLDERRKENFLYTKMANYFINKDGVSFLEMYVNKLIEMKENNIPIEAYTSGANTLTDDI